MPKTNGDITKARILEVAEHLFSQKGFDATSIDSISKAAKINKATIYYHFKDKQDIIFSLFNAIIEETNARVRQDKKNFKTVKDAIKSELAFLRKKRKIISVMMMEAMKLNDETNALFHCAKITIESELKVKPDGKKLTPKESEKALIHEFFTGFIPMMAFLVFEDRWCDYFDCNKSTFDDRFCEVFEKAHLMNHLI